MRIIRTVGLLSLLGFALAFPQLFTSPLVRHIAVFTLIYAIMASAWNILAGYTGYISLGHAAFFGVGAYAFGLLAQDWNVQSDYGAFLLLPLAGAIAAAIATPVGWIALRTRRHVFVVLTISILFIGQLLAFNLRDITGGSSGMSFPVPSWSGDFFEVPFYYVGLIVLLSTLAVSWWIRNSKFGLGLLAIRDDEDRALGLGVRTGLSKLIVFVLAAFFIAMAGALYGYFQAYMYPQFAFNPLDDLAMALMTFAGGMGTLPGPIVGALAIEPAHEYFAFEYGASGLYLIFYGALFLVIILLMPQGIWPGVRGGWARLMSYRHAPRSTAPRPEELAQAEMSIKPESAVKR